MLTHEPGETAASEDTPFKTVKITGCADAICTAAPASQTILASFLKLFILPSSRFISVAVHARFSTPIRRRNRGNHRTSLLSRTVLVQREVESWRAPRIAIGRYSSCSSVISNTPPPPVPANRWFGFCGSNASTLTPDDSPAVGSAIQVAPLSMLLTNPAVAPA